MIIVFILLYVMRIMFNHVVKHLIQIFELNNLYDFKKYKCIVKPYNVRLYGYVDFIFSLNQMHVMIFHTVFVTIF